MAAEKTDQFFFHWKLYLKEDLFGSKIYLKIFKFKVNSYLAMTSLSLVIKKIFTNEGNSEFENN